MAKHIIDIIAPASGKESMQDELPKITDALKHWGYTARFGQHIIGKHPLSSNTNEYRFADLKEALYNDTSDIVWCYRGGYGCGELIPELAKLTPPKKQKLFIGFSDVTFLHIFLNQQWGWQTIHGPGARQTALKEIDEPSQKAIHDVLANHPTEFVLDHVVALNDAAKKSNNFSGILTGGNLAIISNTIGTPYQIDATNKILLLEDINEHAYRVRRLLIHLKHAGILNNIKGLLFGCFDNTDPAEINRELIQFAQEQEFPVFQTDAIGHGKKNIAVSVGCPIELKTH